MTSCSSIKTALYKVTGAQAAKEREVAALRAEYDDKITAKTNEIATAKDGVIAGQQNQMRGAAAALFGQSLVFQSLPQPTRTDLITHNLSTEASAALGNIPPTAEAMQVMIERISKELDSTRTSLADLQRNHTAALLENQRLVDQTKHWEDKLTAAEREKSALESSYRTQLDQKQTDLVKLANEKAALEKERADDAAARQAQLAKLSWGAGILAALCLAGAIWSPVFKKELGIGVIVLGSAAVAIPFIQGWMIMAVVGVVAVLVVGWAARVHHIESKAATDVYRAVQSIKEKSKDKYDELIAPQLKQWITKYDRSGKLIPDKTAEDHIDQRLREVGDI
jgi:hypothetical protein